MKRRIGNRNDDGHNDNNTNDDDEGSVVVPPPTVLAGNSDPFKSTTIAVTPSVNHLLIFTRDFILPANHGNEATIYGGKWHMQRYWQDSVRGLDGGGADGYAYLARSAAILAGIIKPTAQSPQGGGGGGSSQTTLLALQYISKATSKLREAMAQRSDLEAHMWEVYALLAAEVAAHNFKAATVHGLMLRRVLQPAGGKTLYPEPRFLMVALLQDMTRASLSLTKPAFDLYRWDKEYLPVHLRDNVVESGDGPPSAYPYYNDTPASLPAAFRNLILGVREWHHTLGISMLDRSMVTMTIFTNAAMKIMVLTGLFLNHHLEALELWDLVGTPDMLADACLGLAFAYWVRRAVHDRMDRGSKLEEAGSFAFDMSPVVAVKLRDLDAQLLRRRAETGGEDQDQGQDQRCVDDHRIWWLFAGTMAERNVLLRPDYTDYREYHGPRFLAVTRQMGLKEWSDVEAVLRRYLYLDPVALKVKMWFIASTAVAAAAAARSSSKPLDRRRE